MEVNKTQHWPHTLLDDMATRAQLINDFNTLHQKHEFLKKQYHLVCNSIHHAFDHTSNSFIDCDNMICKEVRKTLEIV